jgi:hypothetical protein
MPRASLGLSAKSEVVTVRFTKAEVAELIRKYGSPAMGLRALYAASKTKEPKK